MESKRKPVMGIRLKAALDYAGLSNREAAERLRKLAAMQKGKRRTSAETLNLVTREPQEQATLPVDVLKDLVRVLRGEKIDVPLEWLTGEEKYLPFVSPTGGIDLTNPSDRQVFDAVMVESEAFASSIRQLYELPDPLETVPTAVQVARSGFLSRCHRSLVRAYKKTGERLPLIEFQGLSSQLILVFSTVTDAEAWQRLAQPSVIPKVTADASIALIDAWMEILRPWLDGKAPLDLHALFETARSMDRAGVPAAGVFDLDMIEERAAKVLQTSKKRR